MLFNSFSFWLFYFFVFTIYWKLSHKNQNSLLLISSYFFYGMWDWHFLFLIFSSTSIDYFLGKEIYQAKSIQKKKIFLFSSIFANLSILGFFKYYNFFSLELNNLFVSIGISSMLPTLDIILPVGISFYTFQTMSYSIDIFRNEIKPIKSFKDYALYVSFFPQLVAGPIERSSRLIPQVVNKRHWKENYILDGLYLIFYGLFLKIVIADNMAPIVNHIFAQETSTLSGLEILLGVYAFAFQIYGDFAGYSAIARGIAKWLGFDLMVNFRMPYFATSPSDFWRRWHISLSSWFRDYVYIPLGGNRKGEARSHLNLIVTMFLSGLWHGAAWTYILWGLIHGLFLSIHKLFNQVFTFKLSPDSKIFKLVSIFIMFQIVSLGWLFFRADNISQALTFLSYVPTNLTITPFAIGIISIFSFYILPLVSYEWWVEKKEDLMILPKSGLVIQTIFYTYVLLLLFFFPSPTAHEFIYFQF